MGTFRKLPHIQPCTSCARPKQNIGVLTLNIQNRPFEASGDFFLNRSSSNKRVATSHWQNFVKAVDPNINLAALPENEAEQLRRTFLADNPNSGSRFFSERADHFISAVIAGMFGVVDLFIGTYGFFTRGYRHCCVCYQ